jgi:uncharacterized protein (DUF4415 family)
MPGKLQNTPTEWIDPDDAPELTDEFFEKATPMIGGREVTFEEYRRAVKDSGPTNSPPYDDSKVAFVFHVDADIFAAFAATGDEWEARMNDALREWMKTNPPS